MNKEKTKQSNKFLLWLKNLSKGVKFILVALILCLVGVIAGKCVDTSGFSVDVKTLMFPTQNGQYLAADIYKPKSATQDNKAPAIVICPGFQRTKETQQAWTTELARRGYVAIVMDPYAQGDSSSSDSTQAATKYGYGLFALIDYITTPSVEGNYILNYIDQTKIGAAGHSAGGNAVVKAAARFGQEVIDGKVKKSRLAAGYVSGYVRSFTESDLVSIRSNMGMSYAYYDEGAYQNETQKAKDAGTWTYGDTANGDMRYAPESLRFVNSGLTLEKEEKVSEVEIGAIYGNPFNSTLRLVNNEKTIHALQPYDVYSIKNFLTYWEIAMDIENPISSSNQVWMIREIATLMLMISGFLVVFGLGDILLRTKFFSTLKNELPEKSSIKGVKSKVLFWTVFAIGAIAACFLFIPACEWSKTLFSKAQQGMQTWFFPERMNNGVMTWAVLSGTVGFILFFAGYFINKYLFKKQENLTPFKIKWSDLGKTLLLAVILFASYYSLDMFLYTFFHLDYRFLFVSARPVINNKMFILLLMYVPFFLIFYISNSVRVNLSMRLDGWKEWQSTLLACVANSIGLLLIMVIQYSVFAATGQVYWTINWLYCNILFGVIPMMFILPIFNRYFFNRTGKIYLGPIVSSMLFIMMMLTNSVCYLPF